MSDPQQIDRDLREYLEKEPNLRREDRLVYLKNILHKHLEMSKLEHVINSRDLFDIVSGAKAEFANLRLPMHVTGKKVEAGELTQVSMIESFVSYLNKMNLLKKAVKIDYTETK